MSTDIYLITAQTNLHAGSGNDNNELIDKTVQRDVVSRLPIIHSSSLKGALREYFEYKQGDDPKSANYAKYQPMIEFIFGSDDSAKVSKAGNYRFLNAELISLPVRSDKVSYFNATSPDQINNLMDKMTIFGIKIPDYLTELSKINPEERKPQVFDDKFVEATIEELEWNAIKTTIEITDIQKVKNIFGSRPIILNDNNFKDLCEKLPVIARNCLENGLSKNLWYEEIVPHESRLVYFVMKNDTKYDTIFDEILKTTIQIGANATIGYGLCSTTKL